MDMSHEQANPKNAVVSLTEYEIVLVQAQHLNCSPLLLSFPVQGTLDVGLIDSVCASDNPDR